MRALSQGERRLVFEIVAGIDPAVNARVHLLARTLAERMGEEVEELVPSYRSLLVLHDPLRVPRERLVEAVLAVVREVEAAPPPRPGRVVRIPTRYGGVHGPDLGDVARLTGMPEGEVVRRHAAPLYPV